MEVLHPDGSYIKSPETLISLIQEDDVELLFYCFKKINELLPIFWPEISLSIDRLQNLALDAFFIYHNMASLIVSKLYFYMSKFEIAVEYALRAGSLYDPFDSSEYSETIMNKSIEQYIRLSSIKFEYASEINNIPEELEAIVYKIIEDALDQHFYEEVIGLAIEMKSIEILSKVINRSNQDPKLLSYCVDCVNSNYDNHLFRAQVIRTIMSIYIEQKNPDLVSTARYLFMLDDKTQVTNLLKRLIYTDDVTCASYLPAALQICFDLYENSSLNYITTIIAELKTEASMQTAERITSGAIDITRDKILLVPTGDDDTPIDYNELPYLKNLEKLVSILDGRIINHLHLEFLVRSLRYDTTAILNMQDNARHPTSHTATALCNGLVHLGTTCDTFMRNKLEWLSKSVGWGRFLTVSTLGLIHMGHGENAVTLLEPYLSSFPKDASSSHQEAGALYAIGLVYANHGCCILGRFMTYLQESCNNIILHGACLGAGLACMGSHREDLYTTLYNVLLQDDAISGEVAGLACGLVMLGSNNISILAEMKKRLIYTRHDKIQRGLALGIAMILASQMTLADPFIEEFMNDSVPVMRIAGVYTTAMAYAGTNNKTAVKQLWNTVVSDSNDDVKRIAIISLALVMFREPEQFLGIAVLFIQTYNPHVRAGTVLALGVVFAGTGNDNVLNIIKPLCSDHSLFVRQFAYIAFAMILVQRNEKNSYNHREFKQTLGSLCTNRHSDTIAKFGAYIAFGIMDAGGCNLSLTFKTTEDRTRIQSIVGFLVFQQFWYWFPYADFIGLCFVPSSLILVNTDLVMPQVKFNCDADLSLFAYPTIPTNARRDPREKSRPAILSLTTKARSRNRRTIAFKEKDHDNITHANSSTSRNYSLKKARITSSSLNNTAATQPSSVTKVSISSSTTKSSKSKSSMDASSSNNASGLDKYKSSSAMLPSSISLKNTVTIEEPLKEPLSPDAVHSLTNPCRVLKEQLKHMSIDSSCLPLETIKPITYGGIIICYSANDPNGKKLPPVKDSDKKPMTETIPVLNSPNSDNNNAGDLKTINTV